VEPGEEARALMAQLGGSEAGDKSAPEPPAASAEPFRVLVVEDDERIARLILRSLRQAGFEGYYASDGQSGLALLAKVRPHLVLLDLAMPRMNGLEACEKIRQSSEVPIIIATAQQENEAQLRSFALGADDYILKPFQPSLLIARVQANLRRVYQYKSRAV
jgi:DNA-binding response OmpR family regulator